MEKSQNIGTKSAFTQKKKNNMKKMYYTILYLLFNITI